MEDIKVGEWVRTKNGKIDKVKNDDYYMKQYIECEKGLYLRENITKHSFNLIDLLEVGDIVNKSEIYEIGQSENGQKWIHTYRGLLYYKEDLEKASILTHELYEANCYHVKGER